MQAGFATHTGKRSSNQDNALLHESLQCFAVADGVGGGESGEEASAAVCLQLVQSARSAQPLVQGILNAHESLRATRRAAAGDRYSASTVAVVRFSQAQAELAWVGDSRIYLVRGDRLIQMTQDHVVEGEDHVLTQAIGAPLAGPLQTGSRQIRREPGDIWLVCSDGLYNVVPEDVLLERLSERGSAKKMAKSLLDEALRRGPDDNITVIVLREPPVIPPETNSLPEYAEKNPDEPAPPLLKEPVHWLPLVAGGLAALLALVLIYLGMGD